MDALLPEFIKNLILMLTEKYSVLGMVLGYLVLVGIPVMSTLIEVLEAAVKLTAGTKDDEFALKVRALWAKILPWLEALPHVNIPIADAIVKAVGIFMKAARAIMAAIASLLP